MTPVVRARAEFIDGPAAGTHSMVDDYPLQVQVLVKAELPRHRFSIHAERRRRRFIPVEVTYRLLAASGTVARYEYVTDDKASVPGWWLNAPRHART